MSELKTATSGKLNLIMDAVSVNNTLATAIFKAFTGTTTGERLYTTTHDWEPLPAASDGFISDPIKLGPIGRPDAVGLNRRLNEFIPVVVKLIESGKMKLGEYTVEGDGIEGIKGAWDVQKSGVKGSSKVLVKIADP